MKANKNMEMRRACAFLETTTRDALRRAMSEASAVGALESLVFFEAEGRMLRVRLDFDNFLADIKRVTKTRSVASASQLTGRAFLFEAIAVMARGHKVDEARWSWPRTLMRLLRKSRSPYFIIVQDVPLLEIRCQRPIPDKDAIMAIGMTPAEVKGFAAIVRREHQGPSFGKIIEIEVGEAWREAATWYPGLLAPSQS